jgi:uncharacterized protein (TIGR00304 family)
MFMVCTMANRHLALAGGLFVSGILLLALGVMRGEVAAGIALFMPFLYGTGPFASLGVLLVFLGMLALFYAFIGGAVPAAAMEEEDEDESSQAGPFPKTAEKGGEAAPPKHPARPKARGGAVIMIGPLPIVFGSDRAMTRNLMILALALMAVSIVLLAFLALR